MIDTEAVLVFSAGSLAIAGGLIALLTGWIILSLIVCVAGLACVLTCFYIT